VDPWRTLGVASTEPGAPQRIANSTVPSATFVPAPNSYFGTIHPGQVHAVDLFTSPGAAPGAAAAYAAGLALFEQALDVWLPAFASGAGAGAMPTPNAAPVPAANSAQAVPPGGTTAAAAGPAASSTSAFRRVARLLMRCLQAQRRSTTTPRRAREYRRGPRRGRSCSPRAVLSLYSYDRALGWSLLHLRRQYCIPLFCSCGASGQGVGVALRLVLIASLDRPTDRHFM
jgi:hypothetical protein